MRTGICWPYPEVEPKEETIEEESKRLQRWWDEIQRGREQAAREWERKREEEARERRWREQEIRESGRNSRDRYMGI